jgi:hypothetical protein
LINDGTININNDSSITNYTNSTINNNGIINNYDGYIANYNGYITNHGTINNDNVFYNIRLTNHGTINNNYLLENVNTITNNGTINNNAGSTLDNKASGTLTNNNVLNNTGLINNNGTLTINAGGTLDNKSGGIITNNNVLDNDGLLNNDGFLTNDGTLTNTNATFNTGEILNSGEIQNYGPFLSSDGVINNECTGTITGANEILGVVNDVCDYTPPIIAYSISGVLGNNSWYVSDVKVRWTITDNESDITSVWGCYNGYVILINFDTDWTTLSCNATSEGGSAGVALEVRRDATPPTASAIVSPAPNINDWNNTDITVSFSGTDNLSGLASCETPVVLSGEASNQSASGTCTDMAGNFSALATASNINIDKTAPDVFVTGVVDGETYILGDVPVPGCDTQDTLSGVATLASPTVTGGDTNGVGTITATCDGAADNADNITTASVNYTVITPSDATVNLVDQVQSLNLQQGIDNSLDAKLDTVLQALDDLNQNNDVAAVNALGAFNNAVEAQRGQKITDTVADVLITDAHAIIEAIDAN